MEKMQSWIFVGRNSYFKIIFSPSNRSIWVCYKYNYLQAARTSWGSLL